MAEAMSMEDRWRREELKRRCFRSCDLDCDGHLNKEEMKTFAGYVGFDGTEEEWDQEYRKICSELDARPSLGVPQAAILQLLDDESDTGCFCSDEELMEILGLGDKELDREVASTLTPKSEEALSAAGDERAVDGDRMVFFIGADFGTDEATLRRAFENGGVVKDLELYRMLDGRSRGMGLVTYSSPSEAQHAIAVLNQTTVDGRVITVKPADVSRIRDGGSSWDGGSQGEPGWASVDGQSIDGGPWTGGFGGSHSRGRGFGAGRGRGRGGGRGPPAWCRGDYDGYGGYGGYGGYDGGYDDFDEGYGGGRRTHRQSQGGDGRTVFFAGVPFEASGDLLLSEFRSVGRVQAFWLFTLPDGRSRGMGLVQYQTAREAWAAVDTLSGAVIDGREMVVMIDKVGALSEQEPAGLHGSGGKGRSPPAKGAGRGYSRGRPVEQAAYCESSRVFFAGAPFELNEGALRAHFEEYGPVRSVALFRLQDGRSRGMGICTFVTSDSAGEALEGGIQVAGHDLFLQEDTSQYDAPPAYKEPPPEEEALAAYSPRARSRGSRSSPYGQAPGMAGPAPDGVDPRKSVFFANASFETEETAILEHFEEVGRIRSSTLYRTPDGRSRGMGVVEYMNAASATRAYYNLHGLLLEGRPLVVDEFRQ